MVSRGRAMTVGLGLVLLTAGAAGYLLSVHGELRPIVETTVRAGAESLFPQLDFGQFGRGLARHSPEKSSTERSFVTSQRHGDMRKVRRCTGRTVRRSDHRGPGRIQGPSRTRLEDVHSTSRPPRRSRSCLSIIPAPDARQVTHKIGQSRAKKLYANKVA